jgi:hypothetical protein
VEGVVRGEGVMKIEDFGLRFASSTCGTKFINTLISLALGPNESRADLTPFPVKKEIIRCMGG